MGCCGSKTIPPHTFNVWTAEAPTESARDSTKALKVLIISNPYSGGKQGAKVQVEAQQFLEEKGCQVEVRQTEYPDHAREMALEGEGFDGVDCIATIGGDGTVHEVVNGLLMGVMMQKRTIEQLPPLGIIPCGSGNTLAYDLGIITVQDALENILAFRPRRIDVLEFSSPEDNSFTSVSYPEPEPEPEGKEGDEAKEEGEAKEDGEAEEKAEAGDDGDAAAVAAEASGVAAAAAAAVSGAAAAVEAEAAAVTAEASAVEAGAAAVEDEAAKVAAAAAAATVTEDADGESKTALTEAHAAADAIATDAITATVTPPAKQPRVKFAINIVGYGLPAAVLRRANKMRCCGGAKYNCAAYCELGSYPRYPCMIQNIDGASDSSLTIPVKDYTMVQFQLTIHMGEKMPFAPRAKLDDGLMDMCNIAHVGRIKAVQAMEAAKKGLHVNADDVEYQQMQSTVVTPTNPTQTGENTVNIDGELVGWSPFRVRALRRVLTVLAK